MSDSQNHDPKYQRFRWRGPQGIALLVGIVGAVATILGSILPPLISWVLLQTPGRDPVGSSVTQSSAPPAEPHISPPLLPPISVSSPTDTPEELSPSPVPINTPPVGNSSPITLITRAGHQVHLTSLELGIYIQGDIYSMDDRFLGFSAIPLDSGIRISFKYIRSVTFLGSTTDFGQVQITLTDGSIMNGKLGGVEEVHPGMTVIGKTALGEFQATLADLQELTFLSPSEEVHLPNVLPAGPTATVYNRNGQALRISNPALEFFRLIPGNTMSCEVLSGTIIRTVEGLIIPFENIREIQIINNDNQHANPISIELISVDGQRLRTSLVALGGPLDPTAAPCYGWRLNGKVAIGDFALGLSFVKRIVFD